MMQADPQRKKVKTLLPFPCKDLSFIRYLFVCVSVNLCLFVVLKLPFWETLISVFMSCFFWCEELFFGKSLKLYLVNE